MLKFLRIGEVGGERPAALDEDGVLWDLSPLASDIDGDFLASGGLDAAAEAVAAGGLPVIDDPADGTGLRIGAPVARPQAVICIEMNYAAYAAAVPGVEHAAQLVVGAQDRVGLVEQHGRARRVDRTLDVLHDPAQDRHVVGGALDPPPPRHEAA